MKTNAKKLTGLLLCAVIVFIAAIPAFADGLREIGPTWENTIRSVTPAGDQPFVKLKLSPEGYKITECRLPQRYLVAFKNGTSVNATIPDEPSHFIPLYEYENYFDVQTPEGAITLYAKVWFSSDTKEAFFSVGQYVLDGALGSDGIPAAGARVYEFPIIEEPCESEIDESNFFIRVLHFFYKIYLDIQRWFVLHFCKK